MKPLNGNVLLCLLSSLASTFTFSSRLHSMTAISDNIINGSGESTWPDRTQNSENYERSSKDLAFAGEEEKDSQASYDPSAKGGDFHNEEDVFPLLDQDSLPAKNLSDGFFGGIIGPAPHVSGTLSWTDANGVARPLKNAKVKLTFDEEADNVQSKTNADGKYTLLVPKDGGSGAVLHIYLENSSIQIQNGGSLYEKAFSMKTSSSFSTLFSFAFPQTDDFGKAACLYAGANEFAAHAAELNQGIAPELCTISYPKFFTCGAKKMTVSANRCLVQ